MSRWISVLFFVISSIALGQLDSNSVTVTASRNAPLQPDQAFFIVSINSNLNATLNDVLAAVQPAGLTFTNFSGLGSAVVFTQVGNRSQSQVQSVWNFTLLTPLAGIKSTLAVLSALQKSAPMANNVLSVTYSLQGTQVSPQLQQSQVCDVAGLINDARLNAQDLAASGGRVLGGMLALASSSVTAVSAPLYATPPSDPCTATVEFALLGSN
jgi:hypothetical protein